MKEKVIYADQWEISSKHFYDNDCYKWMTEQLNGFKIVLEIGCGTGFSTLELLRSGHKVISVDKNECCIEKAKQKIRSEGFSVGDISNNDVDFIVADVVDKEFLKSIFKRDFDIVICWNVGTYEEIETKDYYQPFFLKYGLTEQQIASNWESSYAELILWTGCSIAANKEVPFHIIDRSSEGFTIDNIDYYNALGAEFKYKNMKVDQIITSTISIGGKPLKVKNEVVKENTIETFIVSIMYFNFT